MEPSELLDLLMRAHHGDNDAFTFVYNHYRPEIVPVIREHLNHDLYAVHDLEDAYHTFWLTVLTSRRWASEIFTSEAGFLAFLKAFARRTTSDANSHYLDTCGRDRRRQEPLTNDMTDTHRADEQVCEEQELFARVLEACPEESVRAIYLRMQKSGTMADAAKMEGVSRRRLVALFKIVRQEFLRRATGIWGV